MELPLQVPCANIIVDESGRNNNCSGPAKSICSKCRLAKYCSKECQVTHWSEHKLSCKSTLRDDAWQPAWVRESRTPAFVNSDIPRVSFGYLKYLWGNVPAFDVLRLAENEGLKCSYDQDLNLCFAASGDLRNVITTVNTLPETCRKMCVCIINDKDQLVQVRNVIMLLLALHQPPINGAEELILHLWYSARLKPEMLQQMRVYVRPLVAHVVEQIKGKREDRIFSKTWTFGTQTLCARFSKAQWSSFLNLLDVEHTVIRSERSRRHVVLNEIRIDYRDRYLYRIPPSKRVAYVKMLETGVLLPFGSCSDKFTVPNSLLFDIGKGSWLQPDSANPLNGWRLDSVIESGTRLGAPSADIYGQLYLYVLDLIKVFRANCATKSVRYELYCLDCRLLEFSLQPPLNESAFDRIEMSNIADTNYLGLAPVLKSLGDLLKSPKQNVHATMITLFMNAVEETWDTWDTTRKTKDQARQLKKVARFLPFPTSLGSTMDPAVLRFSFASDIFRDYDGVFATYMQKADFTGVAAHAGMRMKERNSIIAKWPMRFEEQTPGAQEAFDRLMESGSTGNERYVEWARQEGDK